MVTDNWPVEFEYISQRLTKRLVHQDEGGRSEWGARTVRPLAPLGSMDVGRRPIDYENFFQLAKLATEAVSDHTGTLDPTSDRNPLDCQYLRMRLHVQSHEVNLQVWENRTSYPIVAYAGLESIPGIGRVFVGLVGSKSNLHPETASPPPPSGRSPSDALGLYSIIQECRELTNNGMEPAISESELARERRYCDTEEHQFQAAAGLFAGSDMYEYSRLRELLVHVHYQREHVNLDLTGSDGRKLGPVALAILGAPIWIRTLPPEANDVTPSGYLSYQMPYDPASVEVDYNLPLAITQPVHPPNSAPGLPGLPADPVSSQLVLHVQEPSALKHTALWSIFDAQLYAVLAVQSFSSQPQTAPDWPPSGKDWPDLCQWFVAQADRFGPSPLPFAVRSRQWHWTRGFRWDGHREATGEFGWYVDTTSRPRQGGGYTRGSSGLIILRDGSAWPAYNNGYYAGEGKPVQITQPDQSNLVKLASAILRTAASGRVPMCRPERAPLIEISEDGTIQHAVLDLSIENASRPHKRTRRES